MITTTSPTPSSTSSSSSRVVVLETSSNNNYYNNTHSFYGPYPPIGYNPGVTPAEQSDGSIPSCSSLSSPSDSTQRISLLHFLRSQASSLCKPNTLNHFIPCPVRSSSGQAPLHFKIQLPLTLTPRVAKRP